jgi:hypothetical protein
MDCGIVRPGLQARPHCHCENSHGPHYKPGPHATWDCPFRYIARCRRCPGFLDNGLRDPNQWVGDCLTRAAKDDWVALIKEFALPIPHGRGARAPPFHN